METKWTLVFCVLLSYYLPVSLGNCVVKTVFKKPEYVCNTVQDLIKFGNPEKLNVTIHKDGIRSNINSNQKPNMQIILVNQGEAGISQTAIQLLNELNRLLTGGKNINVIRRGMFENLPIKKLLLEENGIYNIEKKAFNNMPNLDDLRIVKNTLRTVENDVFNGLPVTTLALSNNKIRTIKRNAFNDMKNLENLHLDGNLLNEFLPEFLINYASRITTLRLDGNLFTELSPTLVRGLSNVRELHLENNNLTKIFSYTFENMLGLENLKLSNNHLRELHPAIFPQDGLPNLEKLQVNDNRLIYISRAVLDRLQNLKYIRLGGNPWTCPCLTELEQWLNERNVEQKCDKHYNTGTVPICVSTDNQQSGTCDYVYDDTYYETYRTAYKDHVKGPLCEI